MESLLGNLYLKLFVQRPAKKNWNCPRNSTFPPLLIAVFYHLKRMPNSHANKQHKQSRKPQLVTPFLLDSPRSSPESSEFWKSGIPFKDKPGQAEVKAGSKRAAPALRCHLGFSLSLCHIREDVRGFITQGHDSLLMDEKKSAEKQNKTQC